MPRKIEGTGKDGFSFVCHVPDNMPEVYIDGVSQVAVGVPITKLVLHSVIPPADGQQTQPEERLARLTLNIPTAVFFEIIGNIVDGTDGNNVSAITAASAQYSAVLSRNISRLASLYSASSDKSET